MMGKNKKFKRHPELVRLGDGWRKPKTRTNKIRKKLKGKKPMPVIGYGTPKQIKYNHPSGLKEIIISNSKELEKIDKEKECIRIGGTVGNRKKIEIVKKAKKKGLKILNPAIKIKKGEKKEKKEGDGK